MIQPLWNVGDVAKALNVAESWVYARAEDGTLPSLKLGKYRRFDPVAIEEWVRRQRQGNVNRG